MHIICVLCFFITPSLGIFLPEDERPIWTKSNHRVQKWGALNRYQQKHGLSRPVVWARTKDNSPEEPNDIPELYETHKAPEMKMKEVGTLHERKEGKSSGTQTQGDSEQCTTFTGPFGGEIQWVLGHYVDCDTACSQLNEINLRPGGRAEYFCDQKSLSLHQSSWNRDCLASLVVSLPNNVSDASLGSNQQRTCDLLSASNSRHPGATPSIFIKPKNKRGVPNPTCQTQSATGLLCHVCKWNSDGRGDVCSANPPVGASRVCPCYNMFGSCGASLGDFTQVFECYKNCGTRTTLGFHHLADVFILAKQYGGFHIRQDEFVSPLALAQTDYGKAGVRQDFDDIQGSSFWDRLCFEQAGYVDQNKKYVMGRTDFDGIKFGLGERCMSPLINSYHLTYCCNWKMSLEDIENGQTREDWVGQAGYTPGLPLWDDWAYGPDWENQYGTVDPYTMSNDAFWIILENGVTRDKGSIKDPWVNNAYYFLDVQGGGAWVTGRPNGQHPFATAETASAQQALSTGRTQIAKLSLKNDGPMSQHIGLPQSVSNTGGTATIGSHSNRQYDPMKNRRGRTYSKEDDPSSIISSGSAADLPGPVTDGKCVFSGCSDKIGKGELTEEEYSANWANYAKKWIQASDRGTYAQQRQFLREAYNSPMVKTQTNLELLGKGWAVAQFVEGWRDRSIMRTYLFKRTGDCVGVNVDNGCRDMGKGKILGTESRDQDIDWGSRYTAGSTIQLHDQNTQCDLWGFGWWEKKNFDT